MHTHPRYSLLPRVPRLPQVHGIHFVLPAFKGGYLNLITVVMYTAPSLPLHFSYCPSTSPTAPPLLLLPLHFSYYLSTAPTAPKPPIHLEILPGLPALLSLSHSHQKPVESRPQYCPQQPDCSHQLHGGICVREMNERITYWLWVPYYACM